MKHIFLGLLYLSIVASTLCGSAYFGYVVGHKEGLIKGRHENDLIIYLLRNEIVRLKTKINNANSYIIRYFHNKEI